MGVSQSIQRIENFYNYHKLVQNNQSALKQDHQLYFGPQFQLYTNKLNPKEHFTKHIVKFQELKQTQNFILSVKLLKESKDNLIPFNILYPLNIFIKDNNSLLENMHGIKCGDDAYQIVVVHKWLGRSLGDYVRENKHVQMSEETVWFVINQLSKSLEILQQHNHASYHILPENIWCNSNHNWFLYDGRFVLGTEGVQQFYKQKLKNNHFMSEDMKRKIDSNAVITNNDSLQQDVYCLGYCIIFMVTGIHPKELPAKPHERDLLVQQLLDSIVQKSPCHYSHSKITTKLQFQQIDQPQKYSYELISLIRNLIRPDPKRRFTIRQIRNSLKSKQQQIFMRQQQQWTQSQSSKTSSKYRNAKNLQNLKNSWSPSLYQRVTNPQRELKKRILTDINSQRNSGYNNNLVETRTLKKQQVHQNIIIVNNNNNSNKDHNSNKAFKKKLSPRNPLDKNDSKTHNNNNTTYHILADYTPIRMISDTNLHGNGFNFRSIQKVPKTQQTEGNLCDRISAGIKEMNSPSGKCRNQIAYMSPKRDSSSSINTRDNNSNIAQMESKLTQRLSPKPLLGMNSIQDYKGILSPGKLGYQSPRKVEL